MQTDIGMNLSKKYLVVFVVLLIVACQSKVAVPKDIISLNDMKLLMWDIAQADAYSTQYVARDSAKNIKAETIKLYQQVFALHKTDKNQFVKSIKYYEANPEKQKILLDSLLQYANRVKSQERSTRKAIIKPAYIK